MKNKAYISPEGLRRFIDNIANAEEIERKDVQFFLAVKDGRFSRILVMEGPYLSVTPSRVQWISTTQTAKYSVICDSEWKVE